jgi:hypothetical protein
MWSLSGDYRPREASGRKSRPIRVQPYVICGSRLR